MTRKELQIHLRACRLVLHGMEEEARQLYRRASVLKERGEQYCSPPKGKIVPFPTKK